MAFYENYVHLCNKIGKSPSAVAIELKLGKPSVTRWKSGTKPRDATILKVAKYFHVTADELVGDVLPGEKEKSPPPEGGGLTQEFARIFDQLSPQAQNEIIAEMLKRRRQEP